MKESVKNDNELSFCLVFVSSIVECRTNELQARKGDRRRVGPLFEGTWRLAFQEIWKVTQYLLLGESNFPFQGPTLVPEGRTLMGSTDYRGERRFEREKEDQFRSCVGRKNSEIYLGISRVFPTISPPFRPLSLQLQPCSTRCDLSFCSRRQPCYV